VDPTLGASGLQNATDLLSGADDIVQLNNKIFGITGGPVSVIVFALGGRTDGTGGADHMGCTFRSGGNIEVCAAFGNPARVLALFEAELSECAMNGRLCGYSTGEALSRWCAATTSNNALADFSTAPDWANAGMPDFVNTTEGTDQDAVSTGCGMAFMSWLASEGYTLPQVAQAMVKLGDSGTLAGLYAELSKNPAGTAWPKFKEAIDALPGGVTDDVPFGAFPAVTSP
jgi:hypothetical protein